MSTHNLDAMFYPKAVALIGASNRPLAVGQVVMANLIHGGFAGPIMPVNPREKTIQGVEAYPSIAAMPVVPDLAILTIPPAAVMQSVHELILRGTRAIIVITAGLEITRNEKGQLLQDELLETARAAGVRILGPNCLGLLVPSIGLNASFSPLMALDGHVAFISHSGALGTGIVDWACQHGVGFSHFVSIGNAVETDTGDLVDFLGSCPETKAILMYAESITNAENFIKAARRVSKTKPIIAIKSGSSASGAQAAASHTGALAGSDNVYDAALERAGILRVETFDEMYEAMATLSSPGGAATAKARSKKLMILTNGGGAGVQAVDALAHMGGELATLSPETRAKLDAFLPNTWSHGNPVDILGDASVERYERTVDVLLNAPEVENLLIIHCPLAVVSATDVARKVMDQLAAYKGEKAISTCWLGGSLVADARKIFAENGVLGYETPENAVRALMRMVKFNALQDRLAAEDKAETPSLKPKRQAVRDIIDMALAKGVDMLNEHDAKSVLAAYGIPVAQTRIVRTPQDAAKNAAEIGFPVVLKILSDDISHKSDAGGVILDLNSADDVREAAEKMNAHISKTLPKARLSGFTVQNMIKRPTALELIVGVNKDPVFGSVVLFGQGGVSVEVVKDSAVALTPLNLLQAKDLIEETRVAKLLAGYRDRAAADKCAIATVLCAVAQMVADFPEIKELDINPLLADEHGVVALDARIGVKAKEAINQDATAETEAEAAIA